jgi:hypothetical protein
VTRLVRLPTAAGFHRPRLNRDGKVGEKNTKQSECKNGNLHKKNVLLYWENANASLASGRIEFRMLR